MCVSLGVLPRSGRLEGDDEDDDEEMEDGKRGRSDDVQGSSQYLSKGSITKLNHYIGTRWRRCLWMRRSWIGYCGHIRW